MKKEYMWVAIIAVIVLFINNLPLIVNYFPPKPQLVFLGRRYINSQDMYTYVAFIEQAKQGRWLFENLYTSVPQSARIIRPSYLFIGKFAGVTQMSSVAAYHLFRILFAVCFFVAAYKFLALFFRDPKVRILAFALLTASGGFGSLVSGILPNSSDLWIPESNTFLSLAESPHFILSQLLMILGFYFFLKTMRQKKPVFLVLMAGSLLWLSLEHTYNVFVILFALGLLVVLERKNIVDYLSVAAISFMGVAYQFLELKSSPVLKFWVVPDYSPDPIHYLVGYGLLVPFALIGAETLWRKADAHAKLLFTWVTVSAVMIYAPMSFQRRYIEGLHIPLSIFAAVGLWESALLIKKYFKTRYRARIASAFILLMFVIMSVSSVSSVVNDVKIIGADTWDNYYYHLLRDEVAAASWLKSQTSFSDVILTNWFYGNVLPGLTGRKVYVGHKAQTPDFDGKVGKINQFLLDNDNKRAMNFLKENEITYIFLGKDDSMLVYGFKPWDKPYLSNVFNKNGVMVYKVN